MFTLIKIFASLIFAISALSGVTSYAETNQLITYHGRILRPDGTPLEGNISFTVKIYSPSPSSCLLWAESQTLPMMGTSGAFSLQIGRNDNRLAGANGGGAGSFNQAFLNNPAMTINSTSCENGTSYTPNLTDDRNMSVSFVDRGTQVKVVDLPIKSVPFAMQAEQIGGYSVNYLFKIAATAQAGDKATGVFARSGMDLLWELAHNHDYQGQVLKNIGTPVSGTDAVNKDYVDSIAGTVGTTSISTITGTSPIVVTSLGALRTIALGTSGVSAGTYGTEVLVPQITVDSFGRISFAQEKSIPLSSSGVAGLVRVDTSTGLTINSGTLGLSLTGLAGSNFGSQAQNTVFAAPTGNAGTPSFRQLAEADIPTLTAAGKVANSATTATALNTADAIIARNNSGSFAANDGKLNSLTLDNGFGSSVVLKTPAALTPYTLTLPATQGAANDILSVDALGNLVWKSASTSGAVTLVDMAMPPELAVTSGPITAGAGTLSAAWNTQNPNLIFASPTGAVGTPGFRALAVSDIPSLDAGKIASGTLGVNRGGTGLNASTAADGQLLIGNGSGFSLNTLAAGSGISITNAAGSISISSTLAGGGTVTNVGLTAPTSIFSIANSPVTGAGTMDISFQSQSGAMVFASPTGATGVPSFRALASVDIPNLDTSKLTSGTLGVDRGGTGLVPVAGNANQLYGINNAGNAAEFKTLTAGTGLSISYSAGSINLSLGSSGVSQWTNNSNGIHYTSGSVGIGTTTPGRALHVNSAIRITPTTAPSSPAPGDIFFDSTNGNKFRIYDTNWKTITFNETGWDPNLYSPSSSGNDGQPNVFTNAMYNGDARDNTAALLRMGVINTAGNYQNAYVGAVSTTGGYSPAIVIGQRTSLNNYAERMRINAAGNVGIGTSSPTAALDVTTTGTLASAIRIPRDSTAMRPVGSAPVDLQGMMRYNTTLEKYEVYEGTTGWASLSTGAGGAAVGPTGAIQYSDGSDGFLSKNNIVIDGTNGRLGVGTATPVGALEVTASDYGLGAIPNWLHYRGATPTFYLTKTSNPTNGNPVGEVIFGTSSAINSVDVNGPKISAVATQNWSGINTGARLDFYTTANGSGTQKIAMTADQNGNVGIGVIVPSEKLDVTGGNVVATAYLYSSDRTLKKDIQPVEGLAKILRLNGKTFKWRSNNKEDVGLIAQEVEEVFPELVATNPVTGKKSVQYGNLVAPLIEASKELYILCEASKEQLSRLDAQVASHSRDIASLKEDSGRKDQEIQDLKNQNDLLREAVCGLNPRAKVCQP